MLRWLLQQQLQPQLERQLMTSAGSGAAVGAMFIKSQRWQHSSGSSSYVLAVRSVLVSAQQQ
jgi:hypothetical protein